jgi:hypothetical protein
MLNKNVKISHLQYLLNKKFGKEWLEWEPETIMSELGFPDYLVLEKLHVLNVLNQKLNAAVSIPEFLFWVCSITNNNYAEFETLEIPNCLELAWAITEVKRVGELIGQPLIPTEELSDIVGYILKEEGFSSKVPPFEFLSDKYFHPGQTPEDTMRKTKGISTYIEFMDKTNPVLEPENGNA